MNGAISSRAKRAVFILCAVVLGPIVLVGLVAIAANDWRQAGATANGDQVLVSAVIHQKNGLRSAWIRVEYKEPTMLPQGGPFVELRARARFSCSSQGAASVIANSEWLYSRDHSGKLVVSKKTRRDDEFGQAPEGGFVDIAKDFVCKQK
jgi:hypothetical protein